MKTPADTVILDNGVTPEKVRDALIDAVNLAWMRFGDNATCSVTANFIAWVIQEYDRLKAEAGRREEVVKTYAGQYIGACHRVAEIEQAAQAVLDEAHDIHDHNEAPQKYRAPYASLVGLQKVLDDKGLWRCAAQKSQLPEPQDCNWPFCGCDPHATRVIEALAEAGHLVGMDAEPPKENANAASV